jgi:starch synthase
MRVLFVSAEIFPFSKTGGLADVAAALPAALRQQGVDIRVLSPGYPQAFAQVPMAQELLQLGDPLGRGNTHLLETYVPGSGVPVWLIDCPALYGRSGNLYVDQDGRDWPDNDLRFALLSHVAAEIATKRGGNWRPDLVHLNDWHTGLVPMLLAVQGGQTPSTVLTIHNLAYQGVFDADAFSRLGLPLDGRADMEFHGRISFLKTAIRSADAITTVSPTYAREILSPEYGCGLDDLLRDRSARLSGILNGVDYQIWDPSCDPWLVRNYTAHSPDCKSANKYAIQAEFGLETTVDKPLVAFMSRLDCQKAPDLVLEALPRLVEDGMQFALLAEGARGYERCFREIAARYPGRVSIQIGYRERLAHRLLAGADILLHPSRFEPCGLVPIYAMRYGTIPLVRRSGGMADTVTDATPEAIQQRLGTGFSFENMTLGALMECANRAHALYRQPLAWRKIQRNAMSRDFSWRRASNAYLDLYRSLVPLSATEQFTEQSLPARQSANLP